MLAVLVVCSACVKALLHACECNATFAAVATAAEVVDVVLDVLQMFRDTPSLFSPALLLLTSIAAHEHVAVSCPRVVARRLGGLAQVLTARTALEQRAPGLGLSRWALDADSVDCDLTLAIALVNALRAKLHMLQSTERDDDNLQGH